MLHCAVCRPGCVTLVAAAQRPTYAAAAVQYHQYAGVIAIAASQCLRHLLAAVVQFSKVDCSPAAAQRLTYAVVAVQYRELSVSAAAQRLRHLFAAVVQCAELAVLFFQQHNDEGVLLLLSSLQHCLCRI